MLFNFHMYLIFFVYVSKAVISEAHENLINNVQNIIQQVLAKDQKSEKLKELEGKIKQFSENWQKQDQLNDEQMHELLTLLQEIPEQNDQLKKSIRKAMEKLQLQIDNIPLQGFPKDYDLSEVSNMFKKFSDDKLKKLIPKDVYERLFSKENGIEGELSPQSLFSNEETDKSCAFNTFLLYYLLVITAGDCQNSPDPQKYSALHKKSWRADYNKVESALSYFVPLFKTPGECDENNAYYVGLQRLSIVDFDKDKKDIFTKSGLRPLAMCTNDGKISKYTLKQPERAKYTNQLPQKLPPYFDKVGDIIDIGLKNSPTPSVPVVEPDLNDPLNINKFAIAVSRITQEDLKQLGNEDLNRLIEKCYKAFNNSDPSQAFSAIPFKDSERAFDRNNALDQPVTVAEKCFSELRKFGNSFTIDQKNSIDHNQILNEHNIKIPVIKQQPNTPPKPTFTSNISSLNSNESEISNGLELPKNTSKINEDVKDINQKNSSQQDSSDDSDEWTTSEKIIAASVFGFVALAGLSLIGYFIKYKKHNN